MEQKLKYIAYCRRSSEDNREKQALSIPAQIDEVKKRFKDVKIIEWIEESHSAFNIGRPKFDYMIDRIRKAKADGIICWHPDRLARNAVDGGTIIDLLDKELLKDLKFCSYTFVNDAEGKMMLGIMFTQSKYFSDKLSKDVKRGQSKKLNIGQMPCQAPAGYINTYTKARGENEIIPDPDRFETIKKMWDLLLTGRYTVPRILDIANNEWNFRTIKKRRIGGKPMGMSNVYDMFSNPFYCGMIRWKGEYHQGEHMPMITSEEYDTAQYVLGRKGKPRPKTHDFNFTGMITCGECGCAITAEQKSKLMMDGMIKYYTYYHCTHKKRDYKCIQKSVEGSYVERYILDELDKLQIDDDFLHFTKKYLNELNDAEIVDRNQIYEDTEKAYADAQKHLDRLTKAYYRELIFEEEFVRQRDELIREKDRTKNQLNKVEARADQWLKLSLEVFSFARYAKYWFEHGDADKKREMMSKLGSNFILKDKKMTFQVNKVIEIILKGNEEIKKEVARSETEKSNSYSYETRNIDRLIRVWQGLEEDLTSAIRLSGHPRFPVPSDNGRPIVLPTPLQFDSLSISNKIGPGVKPDHILAGHSGRS